MVILCYFLFLEIITPRAERAATATRAVTSSAPVFGLPWSSEGLLVSSTASVEYSESVGSYVSSGSEAGGSSAAGASTVRFLTVMS